jgi:hypothetical protein
VHVLTCQLFVFVCCVSSGKRQARILGIDRHRIYNKTQSGADDSSDMAGGVFSFVRKFSMGIGGGSSSSAAGDAQGAGVSRAFRDINTIASVHVVSLRPTCFCVAFKESAAKDAKVAQTREYELETKMECAEIVAKLRFLMAHAQPPPNAGLMAASVSRASFLSPK